ncbi:MAG: hypothetical protein J2P54_00870 [Bradyrhizobiaceae bacterium]|nr:hypothetical protein [Bradyrhizobiaceae bacterium]
MVSRLSLIVALTLPMCACMNAAEREREMREVAASDDAGCRNAGTKPGTPAYAKCREDISNLRQMQSRIGMQNLQWSLQGH